MKKQLLNLSFIAMFVAISGVIMAAPMTAPVRSMEIPVTNAVIDIDGVADADYSASQSTTAFNITGSTGADADFTATFQVCWNLQKLYLIATMLDDYACEIPYTTGTNSWTWDNVEVFLSLDTVGTTTAYDTNTVQLRFNRGIQDSAQTPGRAAQEDYQVYYENTADGWVVEIGIPWTAVLQTGAVPEDIEAFLTPVVNGFDFSGADNDTDGADARDCQVAWDDDDPAMPDATEDLAWNNRTMFGSMTLEGTSYGTPGNTYSPVLAKFQVQIIPNPSTDRIQLQYIEPGSTITLSALTGEKIFEKHNVNDEDYIDVSELRSGLYIVQINQTDVLHFIKK